MLGRPPSRDRLQRLLIVVTWAKGLSSISRGPRSPTLRSGDRRRAREPVSYLNVCLHRTSLQHTHTHTHTHTPISFRDLYNQELNPVAVNYLSTTAACIKKQRATRARITGRKEHRCCRTGISIIRITAYFYDWPLRHPAVVEYIKSAEWTVV